MNNNLEVEKVGAMINKIQEVSKLESVKEASEKMKAEIIGEDLALELDKFLEDKTEEDIKKLSVEELFTLLPEEGLKDKVISGIDGDKKKEIEFRREFLLHCKRSNEAYKEIDMALVGLSRDIEESQEEFNSLSEALTDSYGFVMNALEEKKKEATSDEKLVEIEISINAVRNSLDLENVLEVINMNSVAPWISPKNIIGDLRSESRSATILRRYKRAIEPLNINTDITMFADLEKKFLPEKYHHLNNMLIFTVIKYISCCTNVTKLREGLFLTQFIINVRELYLDRLGVERREKFIDSITNVLDVYMQ